MASVQFSPFTSIFENRSAGTLIIGMPGYGKTYFILNLISNMLICNQRFFAIDPKNDVGKIRDVFNDTIEYVDINNVSPGALNPFKVIKDLDTATLLSIIEIACGGLDPKTKNDVRPIVRDFINQSKRNMGNLSFSDVADYLYANDNVNCQNVGGALKTHEDSKYGPLLFGETKTVLKMSGNNKIISLFGMDLPTANQLHMTEEQNFNSAIIFIICKMLRDILKSGNHYPTAFFMDEAHIAFRNPSFETIIDEFLVLGRSLNVPTILASQSVEHFPSNIAQFISSKFCFHSSAVDSRKFLDNFYNGQSKSNIDEEAIVDAIADLDTGECFFIDSHNRSAFLKITSLLDNGISSNPLLQKKKEQEA